MTKQIGTKVQVLTVDTLTFNHIYHNIKKGTLTVLAQIEPNEDDMKEQITKQFKINYPLADLDGMFEVVQVSSLDDASLIEVYKRYTEEYERAGK